MGYLTYYDLLLAIFLYLHDKKEEKYALNIINFAIFAFIVILLAAFTILVLFLVLKNRISIVSLIILIRKFC